MSVHLALLCPVEPAHGRLLDAPSATHGFFCPHAAHGGNGRYFTTAEAEAPAPDSTSASVAGAPTRAEAGAAAKRFLVRSPDLG